MRHSGLFIGTLLGLVFSIVGAIEMGALSSVAGAETPYTVNQDAANTEDLFDSSSGWRYRQGQPTHWKHLVMNR